MATPLGSRIRHLRDQRGWTQGQLAAFARVKRSWLSLVESGDRERPNAEYIDRVARILGVDSRYLLTGERLASSDPDGERGDVAISVSADEAPDARWFASLPRVKAYVRRLGEAAISDWRVYLLEEVPEGEAERAAGERDLGQRPQRRAAKPQPRPGAESATGTEGDTSPEHR